MRNYVLLAAFGLAATPASTQQGSSESPPITVVGNVPDDVEIRNYLRAVAIPSRADRIARFQTPICPLTVGLADQQTREVSRRMRRVASAAGIAVAGEGCAPNVLVFVAADKSALIDSVRKQRPGVVAGMSPADVQALAASKDPVVSWQLLEQRGSDGRTLDTGSSESDPSILTGVTSSRLLPQARIDFRSAVVVFDAAALAGVGTTQLADYALMRAVTNSDAAAAGRLTTPTILSLFSAKLSGRTAPLSVTQWDVAYLKALYGMTNMLQAGAQRGELQTLMRRHLAQPANR